MISLSQQQHYSDEVFRSASPEFLPATDVRSRRLKNRLKKLLQFKRMNIVKPALFQKLVPRKNSTLETTACSPTRTRKLQRCFERKFSKLAQMPQSTTAGGKTHKKSVEEWGQTTFNPELSPVRNYIEISKGIKGGARKEIDGLRKRHQEQRRNVKTYKSVLPEIYTRHEFDYGERENQASSTLHSPQSIRKERPEMAISFNDSVNFVGQCNKRRQFIGSIIQKRSTSTNNKKCSPLSLMHYMKDPYSTPSKVTLPELSPKRIEIAKKIHIMLPSTQTKKEPLFEGTKYSTFASNS